ncbi:hypothetical protein [Dictyobacter formicarum]|uniref:HEPN AbiU2-like domain-containing protein n=1 Tax=Dictyobacter formicarum TaxID=2778368 RepID=A0ABQ3VBG1_9CHLR|nr:hypothetical protein [Dictyobacter formicarum]GHO82988.1 hypothetical protein KSZ_09940 [Dictyobacter formicarum]
MIPLWLNSAFHLLVHGELHYTLPEDFDRRLSLISFDNAIEASIACYLKLHPTLRGNKKYERTVVDTALKDYHTKIDFLFQEVEVRSGICTIAKEDIIYVHIQRNLFYHENPDFIPSDPILAKVREAAFWIFAFLFEIADLEAEVSARIKQIRKVDLYQRNKEIDELIDDSYPLIEIMGSFYKPSEVLYAVDPVNYREFVVEILSEEKDRKQK